MQPGGAPPRGVNPWQPVRAGVQMVFFAWLINACSGLLYGLVFNLILSASHSGRGTDSDWKLLDRLSIGASFTDLACMAVVAAGMLLVGRAPPQARAGGLATGGFVCVLVGMVASLVGFMDQLLNTTKVIHDPILDWEVARYFYTGEGLVFIVAVVLFVIALLHVATAVRAGDAAWKGIMAMVAIALATLLSTVPMHIPELARYRFDNRWIWFAVTRGIRSLGDLMFLLFLSHLFRTTRPAGPQPGPQPRQPA